MKKQKTKKYNWKDFDNMIDKIVQYIKKNKLKFDLVIGIPRGGSILSVCLSHKLLIPNMELNDFINRPFSYARILLVDKLLAEGKPRVEITSDATDQAGKRTWYAPLTDLFRRDK